MKLDANLFTNLGINLTGDDAKKFEAHFVETLEERVGLAIFELLTNDEADQLLELQAAGDDATTTEWIKTNVPEYEEVVQDEFDMLMGEVAKQSSLVTG